jgi:hypothetical protein
MLKPIFALAAAGAALAVPAHAADRYRGAVYSEYNPWYLDMQTDLSEARRELRKDLNRANDSADVEDAWSEYRREVADARHDFRKEMAERGRPIRRGRVSIDAEN